MIMRCSRNLLRELRDQPFPAKRRSHSFWDCHADLFRMEGSERLLITNDMTMFTILIPKVHVDDLGFFDLVVAQHFLKHLLYEKVPPHLIKNILAQCKQMSLQRSSNQRILSSMNRLRKKLEYIVRAQGGLAKVDFYELNGILNRVTLKSIGYNRPIDMLKLQLNHLTQS